MTTDISQLEALLAAGKNEEAAALIRETVEAPLSSDEAGAALVGATGAYLDVVNSINERYRDALLQAIESIKKVDGAIKDVGEKGRIAEVKKSLGI